MKKIHQTKFEIFYEDTDSSGFTYHTTYLKFAERARSQFVKENLEEIKNCMINNSFFFVVKEIKVNFFNESFADFKSILSSSLTMEKSIIRFNSLIAILGVPLDLFAIS